MNASLVRLLLGSTVFCSLLLNACCCFAPWINTLELSQHTGAKTHLAQGKNNPGDGKMPYPDKESLPLKGQEELSLSSANTPK
jgi:hypothetical protein